LIPIWEAEWGGKIFCSHGTKPSEGVVILPNPKCDVKVNKNLKKAVKEGLPL